MNSRRNIVAFGCLLLWHLQLLYPLFQYDAIRAAARTRDAGARMAHAIEVRIDRGESVIWDDDRRELYTKDGWYDVLSIEEKDHCTVVWCIPDEWETCALQELASTEHGKAKGESPQHPVNANAPMECPPGVCMTVPGMEAIVSHRAGLFSNVTHKGFGTKYHAPPDGMDREVVS